MRIRNIAVAGLLLSVVGCGSPEPVDTAAQARAVDKVLAKTVKGTEHTLGECLNVAGGWDVNPEHVKAGTIPWPTSGDQAWRVSIPSEGTVNTKFLRFGVDLASGETLPMGGEDVAALDRAGCQV